MEIFTKDIMIGDVNIKDILNAIINFVLKVVKFEFPEAGDIL